MTEHFNHHRSTGKPPPPPGGSQYMTRWQNPLNNSSINSGPTSVYIQFSAPSLLILLVRGLSMGQRAGVDDEILLLVPLLPCTLPCLLTMRAKRNPRRKGMNFPPRKRASNSIPLANGGSWDRPWFCWVRGFFFLAKAWVLMHVLGEAGRVAG